GYKEKITGIQTQQVVYSSPQITLLPVFLIRYRYSLRKKYTTNSSSRFKSLQRNLSLTHERILRFMEAKEQPFLYLPTALYPHLEKLRAWLPFRSGNFTVLKKS